MKAIIGLGNPEIKYKNTRHNVGFMVLDKVFEKRKISLTDKFEGFFAKDNDVLFLLPKTYMNLSGLAVSKMMNFYKLNPSDILVVFDDVSLPLGALRFREKGTDGGHNGIKSIIKEIGSSDFPRLKVGIGPQPENMPLEHFVLQNFDDFEKLNKVLDIAAEATEDFLNFDFTHLQSKYNKVHI